MYNTNYNLVTNMTNPLMIQIQSVLDSQKSLKKDVAKHTTIGAIIGAIGCIVVFLFAFGGAIKNSIIAIIISFFGFVASWVLCAVYWGQHNVHTKKKTLDGDYKHLVIEPVLKQFFNTERVSVWTTNDPVERKPFEPLVVLRNSGLFFIGNETKCNDLGIVFCEGKVVSFFDTTSEHETGSGEDRSSTTIFKGQVYTIPLNKRIDTRIRIVDEKFNDVYKGNTVVGFNGINRKKNNTKSLQTENPEFNDLFNIFCEKDADALYILTPQLMEALVTLRKQMGKKIIVSVVGDVLYVAFYTNHDGFEIKLHQEVSARDIYINTCNEAYPIKLLCNAVREE